MPPKLINLMLTLDETTAKLLITIVATKTFGYVLGKPSETNKFINTQFNWGVFNRDDEHKVYALHEEIKTCNVHPQSISEFEQDCIQYYYEHIQG